MHKAIVIPIVFVVAMLPLSVFAETLFADDFEDPGGKLLCLGRC